jgi:hypothetical protein
MPPLLVLVFQTLLTMQTKRALFFSAVAALGFLCLHMVSNLSISCIPSQSQASNPLLIYSLAVNGQKKFDSSRVRSNRERYSKLHEGIEFFLQTEADPYTRLLAWQKLKDYRKVKFGHEWVWLLDSDAFIMNGEISGLAALEARMNQTKEVDIIICKDFNGLNSGSMFIRSSAWTDTFIDRWLSYENNTTIRNDKKYVGVFEQPAFIYMFKSNEMNLRDHVSIIEQRKINSYNRNYKVGDYVIHFAGLGYGRLLKWLEKEKLTEV